MAQFTRLRHYIDEKTDEKRSCKYFNEFIVHVMLVGYLKFEIHAAGNYHKVKNIQVMLQSGNFVYGNLF